MYVAVSVNTFANAIGRSVSVSRLPQGLNDFSSIKGSRAQTEAIASRPFG